MKRQAAESLMAQAVTVVHRRLGLHSCTEHFHLKCTVEHCTVVMCNEGEQWLTNTYGLDD